MKVSLKCYYRGPNVVTQGVIRIEYWIDEDVKGYNIQPLRAQYNNGPQPEALTKDARPYKEVMKEIDDVLKEASEVIIYGDVTGINYYLALCQLPGVFSRRDKQTYKTIHE